MEPGEEVQVASE